MGVFTVDEKLKNMRTRRLLGIKYVTKENSKVDCRELQKRNEQEGIVKQNNFVPPMISFSWYSF